MIIYLCLFFSLCHPIAAVQPEESFRRTQVVVLGAGASGIAAALTLHDMNITDFILVDAQSFLGGRVQHHPFGQTNVELGANWIYGKGRNPIYQLAQQHGLKSIPNDKKNVVYFSEGRIPQDQGQRISDWFDSTMERMVQFADERMKRNQVDLSSRTALHLSGWIPDTPLKAAVEYFAVNWEMAEPAELSSLDYATGTVDTVSGSFPLGNDFVIDPRGFNYILEQEAKTVLNDNDSRLLLNTRVTDVIYGEENDNKVTILTANGTKIIADHALCTFSLGVLQHNDVQFKPDFPEWKREALYSFHMTTYTKIFVKFDTKFWGDWQFALYASNKTQHGGDYTVWQNLVSDSKHDNILMVTTTFKESELIEGKTDKQVSQDIQKILQRMFPEVHVPFPTDILIPRWHQHPLFRGSYSNWPIGMSVQHHDNMRAPLPLTTPHLWFAGEAMSRKYYGYLHGAWMDGQQAATAIGQCILLKNCSHYHHHPLVTGCAKESHLNRLQRTSRSTDNSARYQQYSFLPVQHQQHPFLQDQ
ncbi:uncharacterized protein BX664DRAFT_331050, partial [Halteromyces radiatus]|uniref:uncharacterized protein n=1 Tax=Halteromyces radiatus TaxID=101107 RepID=UPI0022211508